MPLIRLCVPATMPSTSLLSIKIKNAAFPLAFEVSPTYKCSAQGHAGLCALLLFHLCWFFSLVRLISGAKDQILFFFSVSHNV